MPLFRSLMASWHNLSVAKKLYTVVGVMALLVASELLTLMFAVKTLSSVRAFVVGEGLWTKSQKDAIHSLYQYALRGEERHYEDFKNDLRIQAGDRMARLELSKPNWDREIVRAGFLQGDNHPSDIDGMINLITRFDHISYMQEALAAWSRADALFDELMLIAEEIHSTIKKSGKESPQIDKALRRVASINAQLTKEEVIFSSSLGAGSRWLEGLPMVVLLFTVVTVEGTGLFLTWSLGRGLNRTLLELRETADEVGRGNFSKLAPVHSDDELGQLAVSINRMVIDLKRNAEERTLAQSRLQKLNDELEERVRIRTLELQRAKEAADVASEAKSAFLANMSHEIRTPLGIILGFSELMADEGMGQEERLGSVEIIKRNGALLSTIINDILDLSKVEAGKLEIEREDVPFGEIVTELDALLTLQANNKGIKLSVHSDGPIPTVLHTDPYRLRQVLLNIVGNAIKFTTKGSVEVTVKLREDGMLSFRVSDTGKGIDEAQAQKLFTPFTQADVSTTRQFGGTGLGLVLSKKLARALGGDVVLVESRPNVGSVFEITIDPGRPAQSHLVNFESRKLGPSGTVTQSHRLDRLRVLSADDSVDNQAIVAYFLKAAGAQMDTAENGAQAVQKALTGNYDIVLMDLQMPVMDGQEAILELRRQGYKGPVIAVTAHAMKDERKRCLEQGFDEHIPKPIEKDTLLRVLKQFIRT